MSVDPKNKNALHEISKENILNDDEEVLKNNNESIPDDKSNVARDRSEDRNEKSDGSETIGIP